MMWRLYLDLAYGSWEAIQSKANLASRSLVLEMCVGLSLRVPGNIIEFGVAHGGPTRVIREALARFSNACEDEDFRHKQTFAHDSGGIFGNLPTLQLRIID